MFDILFKIRLRIVVGLKLTYYKCKYGKQLKIGKKNKFRSRFKINIAKGGYLEIGDGNFWNDDCSINVRNKVKIGNKNLFGKNVNIYDHNHIFNDKSKKRGRYFNTREIKIGNGNWFGTNVVILSKTKMGDNNVIGAGTIVNSEVLSDFIVKNSYELKYQPIKYK